MCSQHCGALLFVFQQSFRCVSCYERMKHTSRLFVFLFLCILKHTDD
nr:MAG TPA: hypothetical protein [Caudoviricetes sp.]